MRTSHLAPRTSADSLSATLTGKPRRRPAAVEPLEARRLMTTVVVNTTVDALFPPTSGFISLRNAIATASASTGATAITFSPTVFATAQTITLNGNQLELSGSGTTTLTAPSVGLTLSGNGQSAILQIDRGANANVEGLTVTKGSNGAINNDGTLKISSSSIIGNLGTTNSAVGNSGTITLTDVVISGNIVSRASGGFGEGPGTTANFNNVTISGNTGGSPCAGGFYNYGGIMTVTNSDITGNRTSYNGGGFINENGGSLSLTNVTIANNTAAGIGGGLWNDGNDGAAPLTLSDVTISGNSASSGGGIYDDAGNMPTISNTVVAGNTVNTGGTGPDVDGDFSSLGYNLIGKTDGSLGFNTADLTGTIAKPVSAKLGALANNGGPTETLLPLTGSPVIGAGLVAYVPKGVTTDQRGLPRIVNGKVDIGAVEVQSATVITITLTAPAAQTATVGISKSFALGSFTETGATGPYTATVAWGDGTTSTVALTAAGTITATAHTYTKAATDKVTVSVKDSAGNSSKTSATFSVAVSPGATISGTVFNDVNADKKLDDGELGLGGYIVFIDLKNTGKFATGDPTVTTAANGTFSFADLAAGTYKIAVEQLTGETLTTPAVLTLTLSAGATDAGNLFGEKAKA